MCVALAFRYQLGGARGTVCFGIDLALKVCSKNMDLQGGGMSK